MDGFLFFFIFLYPETAMLEFGFSGNKYLGQKCASNMENCKHDLGHMDLDLSVL